MAHLAFSADSRSHTGRVGRRHASQSERVELLDEPPRNVVELLGYHDSTRRESAQVLGVDEKR